MSNENWRERAREKDTAGDRKTEEQGREKLERDKQRQGIKKERYQLSQRDFKNYLNFFFCRIMCPEVLPPDYGLQHEEKPS